MPERQTGSEVDRPAIDGEGGFLHRFRQRRVGVAAAGDVFAASTERDGRGAFGDQFAGVRADDVDAEDAVGLRRRQAS